MPDLNIQDILNWSQPKRVNTRNGIRYLAKAAPTDAFWSMWNNRTTQGQLRAAGISLGKAYQDENTWEVCWWQTPTADEMKKLQDNIAASQLAASDAVIPKPENLAFDYFPFQKAGVAYARGKNHILIGDEMGLGKTIQAIGIINDRPDIKTGLVICPAAVKRNWYREFQVWLCRKLDVAVAHAKSWPGMAEIVILNYDILGKHEDILLFKEWDIVIADECFPRNTEVMTDVGPIPIGRIVDNGEASTVLSYNSKTKCLEWKEITGRLKRSRQHAIVRITHEHGTVTCTDNHRIYTQSGYKEAIQLLQGDVLLVLPEGLHGPLQGQVDGEVLQPTLRREGYQQQSGEDRKDSTGKSEGQNNQGMPMVQNGILLSFDGEYSEREKEILFGKLRIQQQLQYAGKESETDRSLQAPQGEQEWVEESSVILEDEVKQSNEQPFERPENDGEEQGQNIPVEGRERKDNRSTGDACEDAGSTNGARYIDNLGKGSFRKPASSVQGGHSGSGKQDSHRGGRGNSQVSQVEVLGQSEGVSIVRSRVVSVEVLEQGSAGRLPISSEENKTVYCLEVGDNHNFFADGVLVSNCHMLRNTNTKRWKAFKEIKCRMKVGLTGTPLLNKLEDVFPILHWMDPEQFRTLPSFRYKFVNDPEGRNRLQVRLRESFMVRRLKSEVLKELPSKLRQVIEVDDTVGAVDAEDAALSGAEMNEDLVASLMAAVEVARISDNEEDYNAALSALKDAQRIPFDSMARVRHETALRKVPLTIEHLNSCFEQGINKILVFGHHRDCIEAISAQFPKSVIYYGGMSESAKDASIQRFMSDPECNLWIGSIRAAGMGINGLQTVCQHAVFHEMDWVPAMVTQAEDRLHRMNQNGTVLIQHLVISGSLDANMAIKCVDKQRMADEALDKDREKLLTEVIVPIRSDKSRTSNVVLTAKEMEVESIDPSVKAAAMIGLQNLAGMCDGARTWDSAGFNKVDAYIGKRLASMGSLTDKQGLLAKKLCNKYRRQLSPDLLLNMGIKVS